MTNNKTFSNINLYSENINSVIKSSMPVIDTRVYMNPLIESIQESFNSLTESINSSINLSIQPLLDYMNEINKQISSMSSLMSSMLSDSLENLKAITSYTSETIESISKYALSETIDDVYSSLDELEFNDEIQEKEIKNSKLKIVKEITKVIEREVQGEYGLYNIKGSVVTVDEEFAFSSAKDVNCWASAEREDLLKQMEEIKAKINHINSCEQEAIEVIETFMNI